jgi:DNA-binding SARP family transcriptional activator
VVVAAAGYGKTTAVHRWLDRAAARWRATPDLAGLGADDRWLVLDDLREPPAGLGEALRAAGPDRPRLVLVSRRPLLPVPPAWLRTGLVVERGPAHLALTAAGTVELLRRDHDVRDPDLARRVHRVTAGWPALVRLAGVALRRAAPDRGDPCALLAGPDTAVAAYLADEVLAELPAPARRLLRDVAGLGPVGAGLCRAIGHGRPGEPLRWLARTGLLVEAPGGATDPGGGPAPGAPHRRVVPLLDRVVAGRWPRRPAEVRRIGSAAARWYAANGQPLAAALAHRLAGDARACAEVLAAHAASWVPAGGARTVAELVDWLPASERSVALRTLRGEALLVLGEDRAALAELGALAGGADETAGPAGVPPAVAWRLGAVHYRRAEPAAAAAAFARGRPASGPDPDTAMLLALDASAHWMLGDAEGCRSRAERALRAADEAADDRARSAAHVAMAMSAMLRGDRAANATHYDLALRHATAAADLVQAARIRVNRSSRLYEEARYADAVAEARLAAGLAETADCPAILGVALCNEGDALLRLTRLDRAAEVYERSLAIFQHLGSPKMAYPLTGLGDVHRWCGRPGLARAAYEEALRVADADELQGVVPALTGLARVLAEVDVAEAARLAGRALAAAAGPYRGEALVAAGWVALAAGDFAEADRLAEEAAAAARGHRASADLARALELRAAAAGEPAAARRALSEAAQTWRLTGATLDLDRLAVALATLPGADGRHRVEGLVARERLEGAGVIACGPALRCRERAPGPSVAILTLGRFDVLVGGAAVPTAEWRSRKARDLLRILVSRRGRPVPREHLMGLLWGDGEDPGRLAHRLSVALSTVRVVLDPDRLAPADHFVLADQASVALDITHAEVDLETFLVDAAHGLRLLERGDPDGARAVLVAAEGRYAGDFLADEPYEDWATTAREEARAAYLHAVRALAHLCRQAGRVDDTARYLLRLLHHDPYDERAHLDLVDLLAEAGRHGESRRARDRYLAAMAAIGVTPALDAAASQYRARSA